MIGQRLGNNHDIERLELVLRVLLYNRLGAMVALGVCFWALLQSWATLPTAVSVGCLSLLLVIQAGLLIWLRDRPGGSVINAPVRVLLHVLFGASVAALAVVAGPVGVLVLLCWVLFIEHRFVSFAGGCRRAFRVRPHPGSRVAAAFHIVGVFTVVVGLISGSRGILMAVGATVSCLMIAGIAGTLALHKLIQKVDRTRVDLLGQRR